MPSKGIHPRARMYVTLSVRGAIAEQLVKQFSFLARLKGQFLFFDEKHGLSRNTVCRGVF